MGVVLALVAGIASGNLLAGLAVAIGAQVAGFAGLNGTARRRFRTMLIASFAMGLTTLVGGLTSATWWAIVAVAILGFVAGLVTCVSNEAGLIGLWATIALIFISGFHETFHNAMYHALFMVIGGLLQMVLMMAIDALQPSSTESRAVADVLQALSNYANSDSRIDDLRVASTLLEAEAGLRDSFIHAGRWRSLQTLMNSAESVRIEVVALNGMIRPFAEGAESDSYVSDMKEAIDHVAEILHVVAIRLRSDRNRAIELTKPIDALNQLARRENEDAIPRDWIHGYRSIEHATRELQRMIRVLNRSPRLSHSPRLEKWVRSPLPHLRSSLETIQANFSFKSAAFRHAIRLAVALGLATLVYRFLPLSRGYWLPLTTLIVLRPEFTTTFSRGAARVLGTLIGSLFATLLLGIPDPTHILGTALIGMLLWGMYSVLNYNMVLFSCILTAEVVVLVSFFQHSPIGSTIVDRGLFTLAGSLLAFIAYLSWPTWQHHNVRDVIANVIAAQGNYLQSIFNGDMRGVESYRKRSRLMRTNAVNLVKSAISEPVVGDFDERALDGMLATLHRNSDILLSLESYTHDKDILYKWSPSLALFGQYAFRCLLEIESDIRSTHTNVSREPSANEANVPGGPLDEISPFTKQQILQLDVPAPLTSILIRLEENLSAMFRIVSAMKRDTSPER